MEQYFKTPQEDSCTNVIYRLKGMIAGNMMNIKYDFTITIFVYIFILVGLKYGSIPKISFPEPSKWVTSIVRKREKKHVFTIASFASDHI